VVPHVLDMGAHHSCWLVLQALFMTASVPTAHGDLAPPAAHRPNFRDSNIEPAVQKAMTLFFASRRVTFAEGRYFRPRPRFD
jgi:hypothetical protein